MSYLNQSLQEASQTDSHLEILWSASRSPVADPRLAHILILIQNDPYNSPYKKYSKHFYIIYCYYVLFLSFHLCMIITKYKKKVQNYSNVCSTSITFIQLSSVILPARIQYPKPKEKSKYNKVWDRMSTLALNEQ